MPSKAARTSVQVSCVARRAEAAALAPLAWARASRTLLRQLANCRGLAKCAIGKEVTLPLPQRLVKRSGSAGIPRAGAP